MMVIPGQLRLILALGLISSRIHGQVSPVWDIERALRTEEVYDGTQEDSPQTRHLSPAAATIADLERDLEELESMSEGRGQSRSTDPCYNHDVLSCADQSMHFHNRSVVKCDKGTSWFRFMGDAGTKIATACVPAHHCGTQATGWLDGQHPTTPGEEVSARVCYHWENDCCKFKARALIRDCDGFFVYKMLDVPEKCAVRVCSTGSSIPTTATPTTTDQRTTTSRRPTTTQESTTEKTTPTPKPTTTNQPTTTTQVRSSTTGQPTPTGAISTPPPASLPECRSFKILNESDRSVLFKARNWTEAKCDEYITPGWYRFVGAAGNRMPEHSPKRLRCGAHAPGWLNGKNPTAEEGRVARKVCYSWAKDACHWSNQINVTNCGEFYVYELVGTPACRLRYCVAEAETTPPTTEKPMPTQCLFYKPLSDRDRAITYKATRKTLKCDRALAPSWYRFVGPAGNKMADSPPPVKRCSTHAPGWLKGKHPSEARRTVTRTVCYHWNGDACRWSSQVSVTNCGDYFVYHLVPTPQCYMRYCGTGLELPQAPECKNYTQLKGKDRSVDFTSTRVNSKCDKGLVTKWYRFTGEAGNAMPTRPPPMKRCGTQAPGWMMGQHPLGDERRVARTVCFSWQNKTCRWRSEIQVTSCGDYFVYRLTKPPACRLRYCGNGEGLPTGRPLTTTAHPDRYECSSYSELDEDDRLVDYTAEGTSKPQCDKLLTTSWYRFTGPAGSQMADFAPAVKSCGTHAPGWLRGGHPSVADGRVTRKVCFNWKKDECYWNVDMQVTNCGMYFVYKLSRPPACRLRYCGMNGHTEPTSLPTTSPVTANPACANVKLLSEFDRSEAYNYKQEKRGRPKCDRNLAPGWYRFGGRAGTAMSLRCVAKYHCGTDAPGWLAGSHPTTEQGTVLRDVCFNFDGDCCKWKYQVEVRNCGAFYAYRLERTHSCFLRYCGNSRPGLDALPVT